jgi:hypothetical protein
MNWKHTGVVWGAGLLATWYAAVPPTQAPVGALDETPSASVLPAAAAEIAHEAARLQGQLRRQALYIAPTRNPFRFSARNTAPAARAPEPEIAAPARPPAPFLVLSGIAADQVGDAVERTAVISTGAEVVLARPGDDILGRYRVVRIDDASVELVDSLTGAPIRLAFTP